MGLCKLMVVVARRREAVAPCPVLEVHGDGNEAAEDLGAGRAMLGACAATSHSALSGAAASPVRGAPPKANPARPKRRGQRAVAPPRQGLQGGTSNLLEDGPTANDGEPARPK